MIFSDSRYSDSADSSLIFKAWNNKKQQYDATVFRNWPNYEENYIMYQWTDGDRLDKIALKFLGNSSSQKSDVVIPLLRVDERLVGDIPRFIQNQQIKNMTQKEGKIYFRTRSYNNYKFFL